MGNGDAPEPPGLQLPACRAGAGRGGAAASRAPGGAAGGGGSEPGSARLRLGRARSAASPPTPLRAPPPSGKRPPEAAAGAMLGRAPRGIPPAGRSLRPQPGLGGPGRRGRR